MKEVYIHVRNNASFKVQGPENTVSMAHRQSYRVMDHTLKWHDCNSTRKCVFEPLIFCNTLRSMKPHAHYCTHMQLKVESCYRHFVRVVINLSDDLQVMFTLDDSHIYSYPVLIYSFSFLFTKVRFCLLMIIFCLSMLNFVYSCQIRLCSV